MNYLLMQSAEARAEWNREQQRVKDEQQARVDATVDEWMRHDATVEVAMLKAIQEVSGDMALLLSRAEIEDLTENKEDAISLRLKAVELLVAQTRKEIEEQVREHLFS